jgi:DNA-3-methyladenine glycosylase I
MATGQATGGGQQRCWWAGDDDALYIAYHDDEWGRPVADDHRLFEKLCLEGFQSGLSWRTILGKREAFRRAFAQFDYRRVARYTGRDVERLLGDAGIVRHRGKIESTINNAKRVSDLVAEFGSFAAYIWSFEPAANARPAAITREVLVKMSTSDASVALSKDLKRRGFSFVGPTTVYAFMQAMGLVNDHLADCPTRVVAERERKRFKRPSRQGTG